MTTDAATNPQTLRVTVLAGGPSAERAVSLQSGTAVAEALRRRGHTVHFADIGPDDTSALDQPADVVFPALHGAFGEDGRLQELLQARGMRFVGCDAAASRVAIDKPATKQFARRIGIGTPDWGIVSRAAAAEALPPPCVVKPPCDGSSVGVTICRDAAQRDAALSSLLERENAALLEAFVEGVEITVGVLEGRALPPIRIRPRTGFYDYHAKYDADDTSYDFDTGVPSDVLSRVQEDTLRLFREIGGRHLSRADWIVDDSGRPWFLEINTMPGFTGHSLLPKAAARAGIPFDELCDRLVRMAWRDA